MKSKPCKIVEGQGYVQCEPSEATHLTINIPGPTGFLTLPVMIGGTRAGTNNWTWNGNVDSPTLKPSVRTTGIGWVCHSWINDGKAQFLTDSTHEHAGKTLDLLNVCDHEWKIRDDSFSHEFGTEIIVCEECQICGEQRDCERDES